MEEQNTAQSQNPVSQSTTPILKQPVFPSSSANEVPDSIKGPN